LGSEKNDGKTLAALIKKCISFNRPGYQSFKHEGLIKVWQPEYFR
jgi:hypothetical protein